MKKSLFVCLMLAVLAPAVSEAQSTGSGAFRKNGPFIRPELYGACLMNVGNQVNPYFQYSLGVGVELSLKEVRPEVVLGARGYFSDTELTGFADYHAGLLMFNEASLLTHRLSAGMSYGNFEIGGGVLYTKCGRERLLGSL